MTRARRQFTRPLAVTIAAMALAGCVSTVPDTTGRYATPIGGAPVISNETPYSRGLQCLAGYNLGRPAPRIAVGQIADYTGKEEADGSGRKITQGAALMAISALSKAGVRLVERFDTSVAELELKYANNKLIGADDVPDYRKILAGSIPGSDFYLVGGITELNYNIRSQGANLDAGGLRAREFKGSLSGNAYVMNVGLDLRLVDTSSLEVVDVISYQKQIVARQVEAGMFDILGTVVVSAGIGDSALEPVQLAVRAVIERAVLEMVSQLYGVGPEICDGQDPLADGFDAPAPAPLPPPPPAPAPAPPPPAAQPPAPLAPQPQPLPPPEDLKANQPEDLKANEDVPAEPAPAPQAAPTPAPAPAPAPAPSQAQAAPQLVPPSAREFVPTPVAAPTRTTLENTNVETRKDPYRWYSAVDGRGGALLRGRLD